MVKTSGPSETPGPMSTDQPKNKTARVKDLLGETIYVKDLAGGKHLRGNSCYFFNRVGIVKLASDSYYDYKIYYSEIDNSCLMHGNDFIECYRKSENPEYFL